LLTLLVSPEAAILQWPRRMKNAMKLAAAAAVVLVALIVSTAGFFFYRDNLSTHYPVKVISAALFRAGEIPYWNFFDGGGQPLAGNPNTLTFYPDNVLYLFLPAHVAFNLHFLIHLVLGWFAMRALTRSNAAAWTYALSGVAISATAFYNMVTAIALIPFALLAAERRSWIRLGLAFGLLALAGEPVTILGAAISVAILVFRRMRIAPLLGSVAIAIVIASPQLIAYAEIAGEVERAYGYSAQTALNASLPPLRIAELVAGPLMPREHGAPFLFLSLFIGFVAIAAFVQRTRYCAIVWTMLFFALGRSNPLVRWLVEALPAIRVVRFPEKFALPMTVAIVVAIAPFLRTRSVTWLTLVPLVLVALVTIPLDWFAPYDVAPVAPQRVFHLPIDGIPPSLRAEYRERARHLDPLFGAVAGIRYGADRSPDGMFSLMTRIVAERVMYVPAVQRKWLRIAGCTNIPGALPRVFIVPRTIAVRTVTEAVNAIESPAFDEHAAAVAGIAFTSPPDARVTSFVERAQSLEIGVTSSAPALLFVNETYFHAWDASGLRTLPLDLDRLGVLVPAGTTHVTLRFGRHHVAVAIAWLLSTLVVVAALIEMFNRRAGEVERTGDEHAPAAAA
jgi:hypothetical protein